MGPLGTLFGLSDAARAVSDVAEVFVGNEAERDAAAAVAREAALEQHAREFASRPGRFDAVMNGMNRLPRPILAFGTLGLFVYAMVDPAGFGERMRGLQHVPEPLWWLLGAIVSFYFGARELGYARSRRAFLASRED